MDKLDSAPGYVSLFLITRLIQSLVLHRALTLDQARELTDSALLDAEGILGVSAVGEQTRQLLGGFLNDLRGTQKR